MQNEETEASEGEQHSHSHNSQLETTARGSYRIWIQGSPFFVSYIESHMAKPFICSEPRFIRKF